MPADRPPPITDIIDEQPLSRFQMSIILLCGVVLVLDGFDAQSIGFLAPSVAESLHISVRSFGPVFSAALIGLMISAMLTGPIADRVGRKWPVIVSTITFGLFAIATASAATLRELVAYRFLTGLGLGGAMPNVVALTSEYSPKRLQQVFVAMLFCGMPLGALLGASVASVMLPRWGWQSVFYVGGILPLTVAFILIKALPESLRFLSMKGVHREKAMEILSRISPGLKGTREYSFVEDGRHKSVPVVCLFTEGRAIGTILLWIPFFMNLLILYFIVSWLPALLRESQMPVSAGIIAVSIFSIGGIIGSLLQGHVMVRGGASLTLLWEFCICVVLIGSLAFVTSFPLMSAITFLLGCSAQGAQAGLNAIAATFYPTPIRSTGIGWALGVGRLGSIVGPLFGGMMMSMQLSPRQIFLAGAAPSLCAATALLLGGRLRAGMGAYTAAVQENSEIV
jgi:AAHS family 4-hydroxybenzoate transporter-like MFS transporter